MTTIIEGIAERIDNIALSDCGQALSRLDEAGNLRDFVAAIVPSPDC